MCVISFSAKLFSLRFYIIFSLSIWVAAVLLSEYRSTSYPVTIVGNNNNNCCGHHHHHHFMLLSNTDYLGSYVFFIGVAYVTMNDAFGIMECRWKTASNHWFEWAERGTNSHAKMEYVSFDSGWIYYYTSMYELRVLLNLMYSKRLYRIFYFRTTTKRAYKALCGYTICFHFFAWDLRSDRTRENIALKRVLGRNGSR